jgi:hypothetical protein
MAFGYVKSSKAEANTLNLAGESYILGYLAHYVFYINSKWPLIQADNHVRLRFTKSRILSIIHRICNYLMIGRISHKVLQLRY